MKKAIEENGENIIGTWTLHCTPFESAKYLGKLHITNDDLYFDVQFDSSLGSLLKSITTSAVSAAGHTLIISSRILQEWEDKGYMKLDKKSIKTIEEKSSFFKKTVLLQLTDDSIVKLDYGIMSVKKLITAIKQ